MSEQPDHPGYELAYQEGLRARTQQQAVLEGLRSRAATLLAVASLVSSFLGSSAVERGHSDGWSWLAIGLFVVAVGCVLYILRSRRDWYFRNEPSVIIDSYVEDDPPAPLWAMHKQLAEHLGADFTANQENMKPLFRALDVASVALAAEVVVWLAVLVRR
jgi:hypothetical protein